MPSKNKIWNYWKSKYEAGELKGDKWSYVFEDEEMVCFACCYYGSGVSIQRCHIIPHSVGGSEDVSNLHLLCGGCHQKTEGFAIKNKEIYDAMLEHTTLWISEIFMITTKMVNGRVDR